MSTRAACHRGSRGHCALYPSLTPQAPDEGKHAPILLNKEAIRPPSRQPVYDAITQPTSGTDEDVDYPRVTPSCQNVRFARPVAGAQAST